MSTNAITIIWLTFSLLGQWSLLVVLGTLYCVKSLPQRNNPFLINLFLTTYLSTFPPCLLFFTGQQGNANPWEWLCFLQCVLMDGITPMFTTALVVLAFHTWRDLRSKFIGTTPVTTRFRSLKYTLLLLPYATMLSCCIASLIVILRHPGYLQHSEYVYCSNESLSGEQMRRGINFFLFGLGFVGFCFEGSIARLVWINRAGSIRYISSEAYLGSYNIGLRIFTFCFMRVAMTVLIMLSSFPEHIPPHFGDALQVLQALYPFFTFLVLGTQRDIWRALIFWKKKSRQDPEVVTEQPLNKHEPELATIV